MDNTTEDIEFFQNDGADETLKAASRDWEARNPGRRVVEASFVAAYPGDRHGRWVTIRIKHSLDRSYACAD
jgi:hypothetical protein